MIRVPGGLQESLLVLQDPLMPRNGCAYRCYSASATSALKRYRARLWPCLGIKGRMGRVDSSFASPTPYPVPLAPLPASSSPFWIPSSTSIPSISLHCQGRDWRYEAQRCNHTFHLVSKSAGVRGHLRWMTVRARAPAGNSGEGILSVTNARIMRGHAEHVPSQSSRKPDAKV